MTTEARPAGLREDGARLWDAIASDWHLEPHDRLRLEVACRALDRAAEARQVVELEGAVVRDRFGQAKPHPGSSIERDSLLLCMRALRELGLDAQSVVESRPSSLKTIAAGGK